jgi:hypothetical protein
VSDSYNELFGKGSHSPDPHLFAHYPLQETSGSTVSMDAGNFVGGGGNTDLLYSGAGDIPTQPGPTSWLPSAVATPGNTLLETQGTPDTADGHWGYPYTLGCWAAWQQNTLHTVVNWWGTAIDGRFAQINQRATGTEWAASMKRAGQSARAARGNATGGGAFDFILGDYVGPAERYCWVNGVRGAIDNSNTAPEVSDDSKYHISIGGGGLSSGSPTYQNFAGPIAGVFVFTRSLTDAEKSEVYTGPEPLNATPPSITGTPEVSEVLTSTDGIWDSQSNGVVTYTYQWHRADDGQGLNDAPIAGATAKTYTVIAEDEGKFLRCFVTGTNDGGVDAAEITPSAYVEITGGGPVNITPPVVSGETTVGEMLTTTDGVWG